MWASRLGFSVQGCWEKNEKAPQRTQNKILQPVLGVSIGCANCHVESDLFVAEAGSFLCKLCLDVQLFRLTQSFSCVRLMSQEKSSSASVWNRSDMQATNYSEDICRWASQFSYQSHRETCKIALSNHYYLLLKKTTVVLISSYEWIKYGESDWISPCLTIHSCTSDSKDRWPHMTWHLLNLFAEEEKNARFYSTCTNWNSWLDISRCVPELFSSWPQTKGWFCSCCHFSGTQTWFQRCHL